METTDGNLVINGNVIKVFSEYVISCDMLLIIIYYINRRDPTKIPWGKENVETVVESTGIFTTLDKAEVLINWSNND